MGRSSSLDDLARRAHRRHLLNLILTQAVQAICVGMGGVILLLLLGTQLLDWPWLVVLTFLAAGFGVRRTWRRVPSQYVVLQGVDRRLGLFDSLSTAYYYKELANGRRVSEAVRTAQLESAEELSRDVDLGRAVPIGAPRSLYALAVLAVLASSLFALRYAVSRRLDLRPPLATVLRLSLFPPDARQAEAKKKDDLRDRFKRLLKEMGLAVDSGGERQTAGSAPAAETEPGELAQADNEALARASGQQSPLPLQSGDRKANEGEATESTEGFEAAGSQHLTSEGGADAESGQAQSGAEQASNAPEDSNLLDKFREALANLLSKLKAQSRPGGSQMMASNSQGKADAGRSRQTQGQQTPGAGRQQSAANAGNEAAADEETEGTQEAEGASGKPGGKESNLQPSKEGRSGIGKEDGDKAVREAEQLAAMGKIAEIFGKRAANLTGEVTVEVASGDQKLKTPYSRQSAAHADTGGEIHRDEIPLAVQQYVQQYFEEIHKAASKPSRQP